MIFLNTLTVGLILSSIHTSYSAPCIPDGGSCVRDCDCCGELTGTICMFDQCYKSNCEQIGHTCSEHSDCCSQLCGPDARCRRSGPGELKWILIDLILEDSDKCATLPVDISNLLDISPFCGGGGGGGGGIGVTRRTNMIRKLPEDPPPPQEISTAGN